MHIILEVEWTDPPNQNAHNDGAKGFIIERTEEQTGIKHFLSQPL